MLYGKPLAIYRNYLSFVGKKQWSIKYHVRLVSGETYLNPHSLRWPLWPFLNHLIFGTLVVFKIMKIVLYATGAFVSPETLYWDDKGALRINLFFSLHCPPCKQLHQHFRAKVSLPTALAIFPQGFLQMLYVSWRGSYHPVSCDSFCCFWMASTRPGCQVTKKIV